MISRQQVNLSQAANKRLSMTQRARSTMSGITSSALGSMGFKDSAAYYNKSRARREFSSRQQKSYAVLDSWLKELGKDLKKTNYAI